MGLQVQKRAGNVTLVSSYTWSHEIDYIAASGNSYGNNGRPQYPDDNNLNKSNGDLDMRHRWVTGMVLQAISGILTVESGQWYTVNQNFDTENNGLEEFCGNCRARPDYVPGQGPDAGQRQVNPADVTMKWFNTNAFQAAVPGPLGNVGRNTIEGPGYGNFDAAIAKSFPLRESARLKFQAEFYNFTNSSNWVVEPPGSSSSPHSLLLNNPLPQENINTIFGTMQGDRGGQVLQFSLRLDF